MFVATRVRGWRNRSIDWRRIDRSNLFVPIVENRCGGPMWQFFEPHGRIVPILLQKSVEGFSVSANSDSAAPSMMCWRRTMMGRLNRDQGQLFYSFCLADVVPDDHPVRAIAAVLDLTWVHAKLAPHYS